MSISPRELLLAYIVDRPHQRFHGYELIKATGVRNGTLYPQLARWEKHGMIESDWEQEPHGRSPRRYYRLTADGLPAARLELAAIRARKILL